MGVIGFFFLDGWLKKAIETAGFNMNGAEVDIAEVDFTINPLGFTLEGIQIADPDKPTFNTLVLSEVRLDINLPQLFLGNVRINDLVVADVQTNVERSSPAKLLIKEESENEDDGNELAELAKGKVESVSQSLPSASDVIDNQTQNTRGAVETAKTTISSSKQQVDDAVKNLPGDSQLSDYKKRIAAIKALPLDSLENIKKTQKGLTSLTTDIAKDKLAIEKVKSTVNRSVGDSKKSVEAILSAPSEDWAQLKKDFPFNKKSAVKVAELLLGEGFFGKINQAKYWYGKAKPWLARLKSDPEEQAPERLNGEFVRFYHPDPTAAFQLDAGLVSFISDGWPWALTVNDISSEQTDSSKPVLFQLRRGEENSEALLVSGNLDQIDGKSVDSFTLFGKGISFDDQKISLAGTELSWSPDNADMSGEVQSIDGELGGVVSLVFPKNKFAVAGGGSTEQYLKSALKEVESFQIDINVSGTITKPKFNINSDLDNQLSSALKGVAQAEYDKWLADVKEKLDREVTQLRKPVDDAYNQLTDKRDEVDKKIKEFEEEVEAEVRSLEEKMAAEKKRIEQKAEKELNAAKDKAAKELEAARKKAEEEKKKAEDAAKKAAEQKLKDEANKLKDKIKF